MGGGQQRKGKLRSRSALLLRSRSALLLRSRSALLVASGLCSKCESPLKQLTPTPIALLKIRIEFNIQGEYHCWFQKLVQESPRSAFLGCVQEHEKLSKASGNGEKQILRLFCQGGG